MSFVDKEVEEVMDADRSFSALGTQALSNESVTSGSSSNEVKIIIKNNHNNRNEGIIMYSI